MPISRDSDMSFVDLVLVRLSVVLAVGPEAPLWPLSLSLPLPLGILGALQPLRVLENSHLASVSVFQNSVLESCSPDTVSAQPASECPCAHVQCL